MEEKTLIGVVMYEMKDRVDIMGSSRNLYGHVPSRVVGAKRRKSVEGRNSRKHCPARGTIYQLSSQLKT